MAKNCGPFGCGMKHGLFNPFFNGNYANEWDYRGGQGYSAILGTLDDPASSAGTLATNFTWAQMQSVPVESTLKTYKVYCKGAGDIKIKVLQPIKGGGFSVISSQTKTCAIGLNTFSVQAGTLEEVTIPAYSLIAVYVPGSGGASVDFISGSSTEGYLGISGEVSGNGVALTTISYTGQIQAQYTVDLVRSAHEDYIIDEDYAAAALPAYGVNNATTPWTFSAGKIASAGTGLANFFDFYPTTNIDEQTLSVEFEFKAAGDRFAIYKKPILGGSSVSEGTIGEAALDTNTLVLYQSWNGNTTLPSSRTSVVLSNLTLATGVRYRMVLSKTGRVNSLTITDTTNNDTQTLTHDSTASALSGQCYGRPGFTALAGQIDVYATQFSTTQLNPKVLIVGDSITEGSGTTDALCYAKLVKDALGGRAWYSGDGGTDSTNARRRLFHDLRYCTPQYVVVYIGANNANSDAQTTQFQTDLPIMYDAIVNAGATPVICTLTPTSTAANNTRVQTMNSFLLGTGWTLCRFDIALSTNGDGSTYEASLMFDSVHPNADGHAALFARLQAEFPQMF